MLEQPPLSLYIHIPWCARKCPYCDFNSHASDLPIPEKDYVNALYSDFLQEYSKLPNPEIKLQSIFIGGGTPSLFEGESYQTLLQKLERHLNFADDIEITLEANPSSMDVERFNSYREAGINRLSLGIQSFNNNSLKKLGRTHSAEQAIQAIKIAQEADFKNFNLDLMHGLPKQTPEEALNDLQIAVGSDPAHISWYQLTIEPNTIFFRHTPLLPNEDILAEIQRQGEIFLEKKGYYQYEISAFAIPSKMSSHNRNYWNFGDYIGIGAGAHGKFTLVNEKKILRTRKRKQPNHYLESTEGKIAEIFEIPIEERPVEFLMNALRLKTGFSRSMFENRTGLNFMDISTGVENLINNKLMQVSLVNGEEFYSTTKAGYRFLDSVLEEFL
jgi:oxygen-independent coproporphyrinogen-3 oxidase